MEVDRQPPRPPDSGVVLLCGAQDSSRMLYHALVERFGEIAVIQEQSQSRAKLLRGRLKRQGPVSVVGQVLFLACIAPWLRRRSQARVADLLRRNRVSVSPIPSVNSVTSVNSQETRRLLLAFEPRLVVVNGTRIVGKKTLQSLGCPVLNTHAGITPCYRGVHGGYWALAERRPDLVGTTVHYVDQGVDTGGVIARAFFQVTREDSFATYPTLHTLAGIPLMLQAVEEILEGRDPPTLPGLPEASCLRFHPTAWGYLWRRVTRGAR